MLSHHPSSNSVERTGSSIFPKTKRLVEFAPVLDSPDPDRQFIVEVMPPVLESGLSLVRWPRMAKIHPCVLLQGSYSTKRNYDVGHRELLAVQLSLEDWGYWLEGSKVSWFGLIRRTWNT